jgi:polysaccharide export outer membrane protein
MMEEYRLKPASGLKEKILISFKTLAILLILGISLLATTPLVSWANPSPEQVELQTIQGKIEYNDNNYRVGPGDILSFQVYHQPDMGQADILVRQDGNASFNGIGELNVAGLTVDEITQALSFRIAELVRDPIVTVTISQTRPATIYLAGAVLHPGMYQMNTNQAKGVNAGTTANARIDMRVSNILANSGGVQLNADLTNVEVRRGGKISETKRINLWKVLKEGAREQDIWVQSGDTIYVPALDKIAMSEADYNLLLLSAIGPGTFPVRVIGEVNTPGVFDLGGTSPYLASAIAKAGGYKYSANKKMIAIRRFTPNNSSTTLFVEPEKEDVTLRPNDVIFISENKIYAAGRFMETVSKVFSPITSAGSALFSFGWIMGAGR